MGGRGAGGGGKGGGGGGGGRAEAEADVQQGRSALGYASGQVQRDKRKIADIKKQYGSDRSSFEYKDAMRNAQDDLMRSQAILKSTAKQLQTHTRILKGLK